MPVIRVYTGSSTYKELDLDDYYVRLSDVPDTTDFIDALRTRTVYMRDLRLYANGVPTSQLGTPTIAEMVIPEQFNNKLAFYDISKIKFYTSNNKTTWTEFVVSDNNKRRLVGGDIFSALSIPAGTPHFRIEIEATPSYCFLNALYSYWNGQGNRIKVKIQKRNCSTLAWGQHTDSDVYVSGVPGHLFLPFESIPFLYNSTDPSHYNAIRIDIVDIDWRQPENEIRFYCLQIWGAYPAGKRTIYSVDEYKRTTFPAEVKATTFKRSSDNVEVSYEDHKHSASEITSGTLSSDRLPSIPFDLLPVGTSSNTVARGNHNHFLEGLSDVAFTPLSGGQMMIYTPEAGGKWVNFTPDFALRSHTHSASDINSGTLNSARIPNLSASKITSGTFDSARIPNLSASKITSGTLSTDVLPNIPFSKITTSGGNDFLMSTPEGGLTFVSTVPFDRLPIGSGSNEVAIGNHKHSASEITSGTLNSARIPNLSASKITSGILSADLLPSIPFDLLPVGTTSSTVARGSHTHEIAHITNLASSLDELHSRIEDLGVTSLRLLRSTGGTSYTSVNSGTTAGSVTLSESLSMGDALIIECNVVSSGAVSKFVLTNITDINRASDTAPQSLVSFSTFGGTEFNNYSFSVWFSGNRLYFGAKRRLTISLSGSSLTGSQSNYTLYVGRVWKVLI